MYLFESTQDLCFKDLIQYPNIQVEENKFCFLSGKSGTGKSTYLKMLNRTLLCDTGKIFYKGKDIYTYPVLEYRKEVLLVPQEVYLFEGRFKTILKYIIHLVIKNCVQRKRCFLI